MQMTVAASPTQLTVDVRVPSVWPEAVFLRNYLTDWYGLLGDPALNWQTNRNAVPTTRLALICLRGDSALLFQGYGPPPPWHLSPVVPRLPDATRLEPGSTYAGQIALPLPLLEWSEYQPPRTAATERKSVRKVRLRMEYIRLSNARRPSELPTFKGVWHAVGEEEYLDVTAPLDAPITILERTDAFKRFG
jgi:hypothetical protein